MEHGLFPTDYIKLLFMVHHNIWQTVMFETKSVVKYTTGKWSQILKKSQR
jgi:hypothetical protein